MENTEKLTLFKSRDAGSSNHRKNAANSYLLVDLVTIATAKAISDLIMTSLRDTSVNLLSSSV